MTETTNIPVCPPGVDSGLQFISSGGDTDWMHFKQRKLYTNAFIVQDNKILLGLKKRGFGKNKYNGFGGKVEIGESPVEAALRELEEEAGIRAPLQHCGTLLFVSEGSDWAFDIKIYRAGRFTGVPTETDEMRPEWFEIPSKYHNNLDNTHSGAAERSELPSIPFDGMWDSDYLWLPLLLSRTPFVGRTDYVLDGDNHKLKRWWFAKARSPDSAGVDNV